MKLTIIATLLAATMFTPLAQAEQIPDLNMDKCIAISDFATDVMTGRQTGAPMTDFLNIENPPYANYRKMVIAAYNINRYASEEYQTRTIQDFSNMAMLSCVEAMEKRGIDY